MNHEYFLSLDQFIRRELGWLRQCIQYRLESHFQKAKDSFSFDPPAVEMASNFYAKFVVQNEFSTAERLVLILALVPHIYPEFLGNLMQEYLKTSGDFPQLGGTRGKNFRGFLPTGETVMFLLCGTDFVQRASVQNLFDQDAFLVKSRIVWLNEPEEGEPRMSGQLIISTELVDLLTRGKMTRPQFSLRFPAQLVETAFEWDDLVLNPETMEQVAELKLWLKHGNQVLEDWDMRKKLKPGYRVLFHGPPGTGKTMTASLLAKYMGRDVYKIDLSMVVSKFIGETEKNLANLFAKAENKDWILFFDEADALFGKRTNVRDAHDKYANQEVSYLLQRVEDYNGLVILASNFKSNIDDAFVRRFQSVIHFPSPTPAERLLIWKKAFPKKVTLHVNGQINSIAQKYDLTGAEIMNVVQFCCLRAMDRSNHMIDMADIIDGIRKEYRKEGKILR